MDDTRYISAIRSYAQSLKGVWNKGKAPGPVALDILEMFAHNESLSTYEVFSRLRSTRLKMAYKNVHKIIQRLSSLNLLIKTRGLRLDRNYHNAKYYKLTELGIFRLFVIRPEGIIADRMSFESSRTIIMDKESFKFLGNSNLFKTFISPLVEIKSLPAQDISFLLRVREYLHQCCKVIEDVLETEDQHVPVRSYLCSWRTITDEKNILDRKQLLLSLREVLQLDYISPDEYTGHSEIERKKENHNILQILNPQFRINIHMNRKQKKAIATHLQSRRSYEYEIEESGSDIFIVGAQSQIDWKIWREFGERNQLDALVYQTVSTVGRAAIGDRKERFGILSTDENFMERVDDVYNRFNHGRLALLKLRRQNLPNHYHRSG